jgi:diguanylate cyclase (GGDEF)-like protein/PAS domain S-box-containing protein
MTGIGMLLEHQLAACRDADGNIDMARLLERIRTTYAEMYRERTRTQRVIQVMGEEVEELTSALEQKIEARTAEALALRARFGDALDCLSQGILLVGHDGVLLNANCAARDLLSLDESDFEGRTRFLDLMARLHQVGEFSSAPEEQQKQWLTLEIHEQPPLYTRIRPNGRHIEIHTAHLPDGSSIRTYTDITERHQHEQALVAAEREYRLLFDNAVAGIYRSRLDGGLLKVNTAFARLNGYASEGELTHAVPDVAGDWYVDPQRRNEFFRRLMESGKVEDFVSEVYRHSTREKIWVSETAWLVQAADGKPHHYEGMVVDATERVLAEKRILELSRNDALTGLFNRRTFMEQLAAAAGRARQGGTFPAVLYLDLDRFKYANDTLGHAAGDLLLRAVARRLALLVDEENILARLGGDEFAILVEAADRAAVAATAERLIAGLNRPFLISGQRVIVGLSVGIAFGSATASDPDELLNMADTALYAAKAAGKGRALVFEESMAAGARRRSEIERAMRDAIARGEISLSYQPIVDVRTGRTQCYEALMRWDRAEVGAVGPGEFIPIAEETGLIHTLGQWALRTATQDATSAFPDARIAVNVSAVQLRSPHFKSYVTEALATSGLDPRRLEIEITENVLIADDRFVLDVLNDLRRLGIRIALDDFGTGYSSLSYLQRFTFDKIKIDRSFVANILHSATNGAIIRAVVALAAELDIEVVAEGIETSDQAVELIGAGCLLQQGYLYGRPKPSALFGSPGSQPHPDIFRTAGMPTPAARMPRFQVKGVSAG